MKKLLAAFRKYHRQLSIMTLLPMILVTVTGIVIPMLESMGLEKTAAFLAKVHTGQVFGSDLIYCVLIGMGLLGLIVTGFTMTGLLPKQRSLTNGQDDG